VSVLRKIKNRTNRRESRIRKNIRLNYANDKIRISIFRSLNHIYAQAIDDLKSCTLASSSSVDIKEEGNKSFISKKVGYALAQKLKSKGINEVIFDRGSYMYHGRVASLADGLRDGGLKV
jgi:large subunit ribosomal protein L18